MTQEQERKQALKQHLQNVGLDEIKVSKHEETLFNVNDQEYSVYTDSEADQEWEESLNNYIDDCLEIPEHLKFYFDEEKWKDDARMDGRGHSINHYDGTEEEEEVNGTTYYIYRRN